MSPVYGLIAFLMAAIKMPLKMEEGTKANTGIGYVNSNKNKNNHHSNKSNQALSIRVFYFTSVALALRKGFAVFKDGKC